MIYVEDVFHYLSIQKLVEKSRNKGWPTNKMLWQLAHSSSLLKPWTYRTNSEEAQKYQQKFDQYEAQRFEDWKHNAGNVLAQYIESNSFKIVANYCEPVAAHFYILEAVDEDTNQDSNEESDDEESTSDMNDSSEDVTAKNIDYAQWADDYLESKLPNCLKGKVRFGDAVEVPGMRASGLYIVSDAEKGTLIQVGQENTGHIDIPTEITDELCDPIEFYRFYAPTQGLNYQYRISFSFTNPYIQHIFGVRAANENDFNYASFEKWTYSIENDQFISGEFFALGFSDEMKHAQPISIHVITDIDGSFTFSVPINYAKSKNKPLILYVQQLIDKYCAANRLKQELDIPDDYLRHALDDYRNIIYIGEKPKRRLPKAHMRNEIRILNLMHVTDKFECNKFTIKISKPISFHMRYASQGQHMGLKSDSAEMENLIQTSDFAHLCYAVKIENDSVCKNKDNCASFSDLNNLISPPDYGSAWGAGYYLVIEPNINIAAAILRGMELGGYRFKCNILPPTANLQQYKIFLRCKSQGKLDKYLVHNDDMCLKLLHHLLKYNETKRRKRKLIYNEPLLSNKEHEALMSEIYKILKLG